MKNSTKDLLWKLKMLRKEPILVLLIVLILSSLTLFVIFPLFTILKYSISSDDGGYSISSILDILKNKSYRNTFSNSIKLGCIASIIASIIGYLFAFTITRTEAPFKGFLKTMATLPIISPPFVLSLSIIFLFGRKGLITNGLFGITDFNVYGMHSLILVQSLSFFPIAYLTLSGILESIDSSVEDAALNLGASRWKIFWTVTFPLSLPGIFSASSTCLHSIPSRFQQSCSNRWWIPHSGSRILSRHYRDVRFKSRSHTIHHVAPSQSDGISPTKILGQRQRFCHRHRKTIPKSYKNKTEKHLNSSHDFLSG